MSRKSRKSKSKSKNSVTIDWAEEEGQKFINKPGEYIVKMIEAEVDEDDEGKPFIQWRAEVTEGKGKGSGISFRTFLTPKALWRVRDLLECLNVEIGDSVQDIDLDEILEDATKFVIEVEEGNEKQDGDGYYMRVSDYMSYEDHQGIEEDMDDDEDEEEEAPKKSKKSKKEEEPEDDEDEDDDLDEDEEDEIIEQMEDEIDELGLDIDLDDYDTLEEKQKAFNKAKKKASKADKKKSSKKSKKKDPEPEEDDDEDEEDDDEVEAYSKEEINAMGTKDLKKVAKEIGFDLDLSSSTRAKRRAVIAALEEADLLED